jgi:phenylacetate-CoA ligase
MALSDPIRVALIIAELRSNQWKSRDEIESIQEERLIRLIAHARKHVPHYRKSFDGTVFEGLDSLQSLPIVKKEDIRANGASFISGLHNRESLRKFRTTGTTGECLEHFMDHSDGLTGTALRQHSFMQCGFSPRDLMVNMAYSRMPKFPFQPLLYRVRNVLPSLDIEKNLLALKSASADIIYAYPSNLVLMAEHNLKSGSRFKVGKAISVSEILSERARKTISDSFGCSIRDYYAASECWAIAWECEKGSLHINSDHVVVEVVDARNKPVGEGKSGRLLVTPLWRRSMPFIRYEIGDCGTLGSGCGCGRGLHVLKSLDGRTLDFIVLPSGRRISWFFLEGPICSAGSMAALQVVQESRESLHIKIVPNTGYAAGIGERIRKAVLSILPEKMSVSVEITDGIRSGARGKKPGFISKLGPSA